MSPDSSAAQPARGVEDDVRMIVSGNFSEDALGPQVYRDILTRLAAAPQQYLAAFRSVVTDAETKGRLSTLHLPWFLTLLAKADPAAARTAAAELQTKYQRALDESKVPQARSREIAERAGAGPATEDEKKDDRLRRHLDALRRLGGS